MKNLTQSWPLDLAFLLRFEVGGDLKLPLTFQSDSLMFRRVQFIAPWVHAPLNGTDWFIPFCTGGKGGGQIRVLNKKY